MILKYLLRKVLDFFLFILIKKFLTLKILEFYQADCTRVPHIYRYISASYARNLW